MKNKPRLTVILMIFLFVLITLGLNEIGSFSIVIFILCLAVYLSFCMILYAKIKADENLKNYIKVSNYLNHAYVEVVPIHPKLIAIKYNFNRKDTIKAYARVSMGNMICVKLVTQSQTFQISTNDCTWFVCNFNKKDPE